jgi:hypothetical protein
MGCRQEAIAAGPKSGVFLARDAKQRTDFFGEMYSDGSLNIRESGACAGWKQADLELRRK